MKARPPSSWKRSADPQEAGFYPFALQDAIIDPKPLWQALLADWRAGTAVPVLAARFHNSIAHLALELCKSIRAEQGSDIVALSGGVWQNRFLLERSVVMLETAGFRVLTHHQVPPNDGCIALGQMLVATSRLSVHE